MLVVYFAVSLVQVWLTSRQYDPHAADAIMVMGAAQYNGVPSPDLAARLNEALKLFDNKDSRLIMLTGGKEKGDVYTESEAGTTYLHDRGVPLADILQAGGNTTYQNVADAAPELLARHATTVLVTTDPFHEDRSMAISSPRAEPLAHPDADIADHGLVDRALFPEGGGGGGTGPDHRLQSPRLAPRCLAEGRRGTACGGAPRSRPPEGGR